MLQLQARVGLGVIAMKEYCAFPQNSSITGASQSDCLKSYTGHSLGSFTPLQRSRLIGLKPKRVTTAEIIAYIINSNNPVDCYRPSTFLPEQPLFVLLTRST